MSLILETTLPELRFLAMWGFSKGVLDPLHL